MTALNPTSRRGPLNPTSRRGPLNPTSRRGRLNPTSRRGPIFSAAARWRDNEHGSAVMVMVIMLLPIVFAAVGIATDHTRNTYIRASIQNQLDLATVAGAGQVNDGYGRVATMTLSADSDEFAASTARDVYMENRREIAGVACAPNTPCGVPECAVNADQTSITCTVFEHSRTLWLRVIGIPGQDYKVTSTAALKFADR